MKWLLKPGNCPHFTIGHAMVNAIFGTISRFVKRALVLLRDEAIKIATGLPHHIHILPFAKLLDTD